MAARPGVTARRAWPGLLLALLVVLLLWWQQDDGTLATDAPSPGATTSTASETPVPPAPPTPTDTGGRGDRGGDVDPVSGLVWVAESELPPEALDTLKLIDDDGPYPYDQDDSVFENREELLPDRPRGHYREYTVETPGSDDRGARRIVAGAAGEYYWTDDHYASFSRIAR